MSIIKLTYLYCDGPLCNGEKEPWDVAPHPTWSASIQRSRAAKLDGWVNQGGKDYCQECVEKMRTDKGD